MTTRADITDEDGWFQAEDKILQFRISSRDEVGVVRIKDITDWTIRWVLSETSPSGPQVLGKVATVLDPAGICIVDIDSADTDGMTPDQYWYTLWRTDSGSKTLLSWGYANLLEPVTVVPS